MGWDGGCAGAGFLRLMVPQLCWQLLLAHLLNVAQIVLQFFIKRSIRVVLSLQCTQLQQLLLLLLYVGGAFLTLVILPGLKGMRM